MPLLSDLAQEVVDELGDTKYINQSHYSKNTYANGCRGPLCRKAERDIKAQQYAAANPDRTPRPRRPEAIARDAYLNQVLAIIKPQPQLEGVS